jgi:fatty acid desaturase
MLIHVGALIGGAILFFSSGPWLVRAAGVALCSLGSLGVASNAHTASHRASARRRITNMVWTSIGFSLLNGLSSTYWSYRHIAVHHRHPNIVGVDQDVDYRPFFTIIAADAGAAGSGRRAWSRVQAFFLPLALLLNFINYQRSGWRYLLRRGGELRRPGRRHAIDVSLLALGNALWIAVPWMFGKDLASVAVFWLLRAALNGVAMFVCFVPAHTPAEAALVAGDDRGKDPVLLQTATTLNFRAGPVAALFLSGLQYQIEHHLFPEVSHVHYPALSIRVKAFCDRHGYPHRTLGWGEALIKTFRVFLHPKPVLPPPFASERQPSAPWSTSP